MTSSNVRSINPTRRRLASNSTATYSPCCEDDPSVFHLSNGGSALERLLHHHGVPATMYVRLSIPSRYPPKIRQRWGPEYDIRNVPQRILQSIGHAGETSPRCGARLSACPLHRQIPSHQRFLGKRCTDTGRRACLTMAVLLSCKQMVIRSAVVSPHHKDRLTTHFLMRETHHSPYLTSKGHPLSTSYFS